MGRKIREKQRKNLSIIGVADLYSTSSDLAWIELTSSPCLYIHLVLASGKNCFVTALRLSKLILIA